MRSIRIFILASILGLYTVSLKAQLMGKIQDLFTEDIFFVQLKKVHATVQGEEGIAVPIFLEKTMKNPQSISIEQFRKEKERYYGLCKEYNQIIEDIIQTIHSLDRIRELREVNLGEYQQRIGAIGSQFEAFFKDLSKYHQEAAIVGILIDIYKLGKPVIQHLIQEKVETIKRILTEQLRSLKIVPLQWEATEAIVRDKHAPSSQEEVRAKLGLPATEHYRSLNLSAGATQEQINKSHAKLVQEYGDEVTNSSNPEIKEFFTVLIQRADAAKAYFDANPPKAMTSQVDNPNPTNHINPGCAELKGEIKGLLGASEFMSKEQLVEKLQAVLLKY